MSQPSRRLLVLGLAASGLAGCMGPTRQAAGPAPTPAPFDGMAAGSGRPDYAVVYAALSDDKFPVPAVDYRTIDPAFLRQDVEWTGREPPGTIVVDPKARVLHHVLPGGRATRYGVGVGKEGFAWTGSADIRSKQEWPDWYPPKEMVKRRPEIKPQLTKLQSGIGMHGGVDNPLGARAMYLWQGDRDTLFRIHGTVEPDTIGTSVSSGCIRMINQDVIHLYGRTPAGTRVVVRSA